MSREIEPRVHFRPVSLPIQVTDPDLEAIKAEVLSVIADDVNYPRKLRNGNFFKKPSPLIRKFATQVIENSTIEKDLVWHFEVFYSKEPVLLHNDRNYFSEYNELCERGMIIPIEIVKSTGMVKGILKP